MTLTYITTRGNTKAVKVEERTTKRGSKYYIDSKHTIYNIGYGTLNARGYASRRSRSIGEIIDLV